MTILDRFLLPGRVAVVTGAGRGIGAATAVALAEAGADVVISARTTSQLDEVAKQIAAVGRRAEVVTADLADLDAVAGLAEAAREAFGRLDVVVNNLGGSMPRPFLDTSPGFLTRSFQFNVATAHALTRAAVPIMLASEGDGSGGSAGGTTGGSAGGSAGGSVVNISSTIGRVAGRGYLGYGTAKAALSHYTRLAARDLAPRIRVNAIAVGATATSALDVVLADDDMRTSLEESTPLRRVGHPDDIAATVLFLASEAGSYLTGKVVEADGGLDAPNVDLGLPDL